MIVTFGAILGLMAVIFGAFSEHTLHGQETEETLRQLMTAIHYQQVHSVVIISIGFYLLHPNTSTSPVSTWLSIAAYGFVIAICLFCFSIYAATIFATPILTYLTPVGGISFMISWLLVAWAGVKHEISQR